MQVELFCSNCTCCFTAPPDMASDHIWQRMADDGPWYALGDGETFEDMIFTTLTDHGQISCPDCGAWVSVNEESLGQMAMELLAQW